MAESLTAARGGARRGAMAKFEAEAVEASQPKQKNALRIQEWCCYWPAIGGKV
jgi:hypothetical protein